MSKNSTEDLLEKSIIDAKRVKQVALQSAERALKQKFSSDLKKLYLKKLNEDNDIDLSIGDDILEEDYSFMDEGDQDPMGLDSGESLPGTDDAEIGDAGLGHMGGDMSQEMEGGLGGNPGGGLDQGPNPAPNTISPIEPQIPATHDDITLPNGTEPDEIELELVFDKDQSLPGDINQFMQNDMETPDGLNEPGMGNPTAPQTQTPGMGPQGGGAPQQGQGGLFDDEDGQLFNDDEDQLNQEQPNFDFASVQLDDDVLLEYIERSLKNDELTKKLQDEVQFLVQQFSELTKKLENSNKVLESLQKQNLRLVYQNKALIDDSLSEHQKQNIVKALNKVETINEAKAVYETAKSSVKSKPNGNSLNQIYGAKATGTTNLIRENRSEVGYLPHADRWQELAGIKKSK